MGVDVVAAAAAGAAVGGDPAPPSGSFLLQWHITDRCNLRCAHCYGTPGPDGPDLAGWLAILEDFRSFLKTPCSWGGPPIRGHITLAGGEPLLHPEIRRFIAVLALHRRELSFAILTNGTLIDGVFAEFLAEAGPAFVQVSLDGRPAVHDQIRGSGAHAAAVAGIRHLVRAGVPTFIAFTVHRRNLGELRPVIRIARRLRVQRVWADRMIPAGRGARMADECLSPAETLLFLNTLNAEHQRAKGWFGGRTEVAMHRALQFLAGGTSYRCTAGRTLLALLPDGTVLPCRRMPVPVGNLRRTPLLDIYRKSRFLDGLRRPGRIDPVCSACPHWFRCGGGLRCLSYAVYGDPFGADPGCPLAGRHRILESGLTGLNERTGGVALSA